MQVRYDDGESHRHLMSRTKWREGEGDGEDSSASSDGDGEEFDGEEFDGDGGGEDRLAAEEAQQQQTPRQRHAASARPPLPAGAAASAPTSAGLVEWPEARVDLKLGEAAFARGWRVVEAWPGGAAKSHWRYISPDGTAFSSVKHVQEAQQEVQQEAQQEARQPALQRHGRSVRTMRRLCRCTTTCPQLVQMQKAQLEEGHLTDRHSG